MKVKDFMVRKVYTLNPDDSVLDVIELFSDKGISGAPVIKDGRVDGMVSERDVIKTINVYGKIQTPSEASLGFILSILKSKGEFKGVKRGLKELKDVKVKEIMSKEVITVREDEDFNKVVRLIDKYDVNRVPVLNEEGKLVGIVCRADIIKSLA